MAYQFFAKAQQSKPSASPPLSPPQAPFSNGNRPPIHPPPLVLPQSVSSSSKSKPPTSTDPAFQPIPYPHPISASHATPHPHITIEAVSTAHIPSLTRITGLLLPIRYPNSFYTATITDPVIASLSRVAIYHDHPVAAPSPSSSALAGHTGTDKVIGGIRCRLERGHVSALGPDTRNEPTNLYIQTLHLLSPYRGSGVAASLLNALLFSSAPARGSESGYQVSDLVKHYNIRTVTAHVHEANEEGLRWYIARGFKVEDGVVEGYYRRLKPSGAKIVKLVINWTDDEESKRPVTKEEDHGAASQPSQKARREPKEGDASKEEDDDWEKVEAEDDDDSDPEDHGVQAFADSRLLDVEEVAGRKRKAHDEP